MAKTMMDMSPALLERWMRDYYFEVDYDLGSSGVRDYSMEEIRRLTGLAQEELDGIVFHDSRTLGDPDLRVALAGHLGLPDPETVVPTHGSSEGIYLVMNALLEPGDEVVVLDPCYQQLFAFAENLGCRLVHWPLRFEDGFVPDLDRAAELIGPKTRMIVVNLPHNPTGATVSQEGQLELVRMAQEVGAYLVWDGAFTRMTYDAPPLPEPLLDYPRALSLGTLSKSYGLPGLRVGWCTASREVLERFAHIRDYTILHLSPLVERIARAVMEHGDRILEDRRTLAAANRETLGRWMDQQEGRIRWVRPAGGVSSFPRLDAVDDVDAFCHRLAEEAGVMLVPGSCFGYPRHVRLGFGGDPRLLEEGLGRLSEALKHQLIPA